EFALANAAGLIGPDTVCVTTVHELQVRADGTIPLTSHDVPLHFIVTPDRVIECRRSGPRPAASIDWDDLTEEKIAAIPLLAAQRQPGQRREAQKSRSPRLQTRGEPVGDRGPGFERVVGETVAAV